MTSFFRIPIVIILALAAVVAAIFFGIESQVSHPTITITVDFTEAPGLYAGNHVDVLGIPVGTITEIDPEPTHVVVKMQVASNVAIPKNAIAALEAPDLVNDRYVQLLPAYRGGPRLADGGVIPMSRTALPQSADQIISTLDQLVLALGPTGANAKGAVSRFVHDVASTVGGNGPNFHTTVVALGQALSALSSDGPALTSLLDNVGSFAKQASANTSAYDAFMNDVTEVSGIVAADHQDLGTILSSLSDILSRVTTFANDNQASISSTVSSLQSFVAAIDQQQQALASAFDVGGVALQNLNAAFSDGPNGTTVLNVRYDPATDTAGFVAEICGNEEDRIFALGLMQAKAPEYDLACAASAGLAQISPPPNAAQGPNLTISALASGSS